MKKSWGHQQREVDGFAFEENRMLVWDMRTGKSKAAIDSFIRNYEGLGPRRVLVVAPAGVRDNWILQEFPEHCDRPWRGFAWVSSRAGTQRFQREWQEFISDPDQLQVFAINMEAFHVARADAYIRTFVKREPCALIVDEAHHFGKSGAKISMRLKSTSRLCQWRRVLTGTPIDNSPLRFYSICNILKPDALGFHTVAEFNARYADWILQSTRSRTYPKVVGYKNLDELVFKVRQFASLVKREDCNDLPTVFSIDRKFWLTETQLQMVSEIKGRMKDETMDLRAGITAIQGVTSGLGVTGENPRLEALRELVEELDGEKTIIWCRFTADIDALMREFGDKAVRYDGRVSRMDRLQALDRFRADKTVQLFIGQPAACGEGLNLSCASVVVWYSHTYDAQIYNQASDRAIMMGGKDIPAYRLIADGGWDEQIIRALAWKDKNVQEVENEWRKQMDEM